ncbi:uncharacterized protein LOC101852509 [Aplysia californica]|uniref:Uncharacterized protein LOC101852509 n=1 Tax=Aplysia californica TaxID=6500 RepID=A0ABM0K505_APLCA|nr:uncharacterized protein LOC101852509 [Aplysia californica]
MDVSLSCQSAINLIFGLSNSEYLRAFPDALQSLHDRFPGGAVRYSDTEEAEMEDTRLREENIRLHAAVWVLRDNHGLQADSTLAAIFRLEEAKFKEKFPFDYESGGVGSLCSTGCPDYRNNNKTDKRTKRCHERPPVQLSKESGNKAVTSTSGSRRSRSASAKQYTGYKTSQPLLLHQRRSNSMWGREDFTSNRTPSSPSWHRPLSTPDPPKKRGEARTACEPIARRFVQEGWASSCDNPKEGGSFKMLKRSPSAAGRIEGQSCADGCEFTSRQNPAWLKAMNELQHCSAKLGLEINGPHKGRWGSRSRVAKCVSFAEPLTDSHRHRQSSLDDIYCRPDQVNCTTRAPYCGFPICKLVER